MLCVSEQGAAASGAPVARVRGRPVPARLLGSLRDSTGSLTRPAQLRRRFAEDGYVYVRGAIAPSLVAAARHEVLHSLGAVDEIEPDSDGVFTGRSQRDARHADRGEFWRAVSAGAHLRTMSHGDDVRRVVEALIDEPAVALDYLM